MRGLRPMARMGIGLGLMGGGAAQYGPELVANPGFEIQGGLPAESANWSVYSGSIERVSHAQHSGAYSELLIATAARDGYIYSDPITVTPGDLCLLRFWSWDNGAISGRYAVYDVTHSAFILVINPVPIHNGWGETLTEILVPAGCTQVALYFLVPDLEAAVMYLDDVSFRKHTAPFFYDGFDRADGDPLISPSGFAYHRQNTGGTDVVIASKQLDLQAGVGYGYLYVDLPATPTSMFARFRFKDDNTGAGDPAVFASSNDRAKIAVYTHMLHFYITQTSWIFQTVDDAGVYTTLGGGVLALSLDTDYEMRMAISGNTVTLTGLTIEPQVITDASIGAYAGQFVYYELTRTAADRRTPTFQYIEARY